VGGEGVGRRVREGGVGMGGEMTQALYAHMNNKTIKILLKKKKDIFLVSFWVGNSLNIRQKVIVQF
jgi:hypothetical protein